MSKLIRRRTYMRPAGVSKTFSTSLRLISGTPGPGSAASGSVELLEDRSPNMEWRETVKDEVYTVRR